MRSFEAFSAHDFEFFVADLLGEIDGIRYEVFARGADGGIDLRHVSFGGAVDIVQCKRYVNSSFSHLRASANREVVALSQLRSKICRYRLVTTLPLTPANKDELAQILSDYVDGPDGILGAGDLEAMLDQNERVERRHPKLWLSGGLQLETVLNNGIYQRSAQLLEETKETLPRYVETNAFASARERFRRDRVLIIAGPPGIGKTTMARMLLADAALDGFEPVSISADAQEAFDVFDPAARQAFYYDDFLGTIFLQLRLLKNEDKRIAQLIRRVATSETSLFLMTTREHILQQALDTSELLTREGVEARRFLLELEDYSEFDKARIFYNHICDSGQLDRKAKDGLLEGRAYERILEHPNYNPRLIEHITGLGSYQLEQRDLDNYVRFALQVLNDPTQIWRHAFDHQLDAAQRGLLIVLTTMQSQVVVADLEAGFRSYCEVAEIKIEGRLFARALQVLEDSFITISHSNGDALVKTANPSIGDFVAQWLREAPDEIRRALDGAAFFSQVEWLRYTVLETLGRVPRGQEQFHRGQFGWLNNTDEITDFLRASFASAMIRTFDGPETSWRAAPPPGPRTLARARLNRVERLSFAMLAMRADRRLREQLDRWLADEIDRETASWEGEAKFDVDISSVVKLFGQLSESNLLSEEFVDRLKPFIDVRLDLTSDWDELLRLRRMQPDLYGPEEWTEMQTRFSEFLDEAIELQGNYFRNLQEVSELELLAGAMGVKIDSGRMRELRQELIEMLSEEGGTATLSDLDEDPDRETIPAEGVDESSQIVALFKHLESDME